MQVRTSSTIALVLSTKIVGLITAPAPCTLNSFAKCQEDTPCIKSSSSNKKNFLSFLSSYSRCLTRLEVSALLGPLAPSAAPCSQAIPWCYVPGNSPCKDATEVQYNRPGAEIKYSLKACAKEHGGGDKFFRFY